MVGLRMKTIFVNGTFDIVHTGHLKMLNYAKALGDRLVVAIDSDERVAQLKGPSRPINTVEERKFLLENLRAVDEVYVFATDEELRNIIKQHNPYSMVKGSDYKGKPIIGDDLVHHIVLYPLLDDYSTTQKIKHITNR